MTATHTGKVELDPRAELEKACAAAGGQRPWGRIHGISPSYINKVLRDGKSPGDAILTALGIERVYRRRRSVAS